LAVNRLVVTDDDVCDLVVGLARDLAATNVKYAEVTVTPDAHLMQGIAPDAVADALTRGRDQARAVHGVELAWVFDIPGESGLPSAERTIDWVERFRPGGSVGFGLGGPEIGVPRDQFGPVFARALDLGLTSVPHAGETSGPQAIWDSVNVLKARRIGHGIAAAQDPALLQHLAAERIVLEVCPTSNLRTRAVARIEEHPLPALVAAGVPVVINTDDPGMFDTDLNREYQLVQDAFGYDLMELAGFVQAGIEAALCPPARKKQLGADLDRYLVEIGAR